VDNGSTDGTCALVRDRYPWVHLVEAGRNLGFAAGNLRAAEHARGDVLVLLNPDTVVLSGALDALASALLADDGRAIAGACLLAEDGSPVTSWGDFPTVGWAMANTVPWASAGVRVRSRVRMDGTCAGLSDVAPVGWVSGAALAIRRSTWDAFGGMDPGYFLYYEETDLCFRVRAAGGEVVTVPEARIMHLEGATVGTQSVRQYVWSTRSLIRFLRRNRGWLAGAVVSHWVFEVNLFLWLVSVVAGPFSAALRARRPRYDALIKVGLGARTSCDPEGGAA
jgi:GT2 family glycosyltransferase